MSDNIKWNYSMKEAPKDGTEILISDGYDIYLAVHDGDMGWCCNGINYLDLLFIAWAPINLPSKLDDVILTINARRLQNEREQ